MLSSSECRLLKFIMNVTSFVDVVVAVRDKSTCKLKGLEIDDDGNCLQNDFKGLIYHTSVRTNIYWIQLDDFFFTPR